MKIGIDFDRVLFRTDEFKQHLFNRFEMFEETYPDAKVDEVYRPEKHAKLMGVKVSEIFDELHHAEDFLYSDVDTLEKLEDHELIVVSRGDSVYQKELIRNSEILEFVDDFFVIEDGPKDSIDIDFLVDDWKKELERVEVPGLLFDRKKHSVTDIIRKVKELDGQ